MKGKKTTRISWIKEVTENPRRIKDMKQQTEKCCLIAVKQNGLLLEFCNIRTERVIREAVLENSKAFKFLKTHEQIKEISELAVQRNPLMLRYVRDKTETMCVNAVSRNFAMLHYVQNQTHRICSAAIICNTHALSLVRNQTFKICLQAARKDKKCLNYIENKFYRFLVSMLTR